MALKDRYRFRIWRDTDSLWDAFWYAVVALLSGLQVGIISALIRAPIWIGGDNRVYTPRTLDDRHLRNIIRLLEREGEQENPIYPKMLEELARRRTQDALQKDRAR